MDQIQYIVFSSKNSKFRLFFANIMHMEDNDSLLTVTASGPKFDTIEEARIELSKDLKKCKELGIKVCLNHIESAETGMSWLSELEAANPDVFKEEIKTGNLTKSKSKTMKLIELLENPAGGIDLVTERDSGNPIRILTGKPSASRKYFKQLKLICDIALLDLKGRKDRKQHLNFH